MTTYLGTATGTTHGIEGDTTITTANGIKGSSTTVVAAIYGTSSASGSAGIYGDNSSAGSGVYGSNSNANGVGVHGYGGAGVEGITDFDYGWGVYASTNNTNSIGVLSHCFGGYGGCLAGKFIGDVDVSGTLTKTAGSFLIDHPLDPANRYLEHSFVESPERKNVYDGTGVADAAGEILVTVPLYVEAANADFRYQLTALGSPAPNLHIKQELSGGRFIVGGAAPQQKVCWQLTGVRKDAWAAAHPLIVERDKPDHEKGFFRHPEVHGQPETKGLGYQLVATRPRPQPPKVPGLAP